MNKVVKTKNNVGMKLAAFSTAVGSMMFSIVPAFAENLGVWQGAATTISGILTTLESALKSIVVPIAGVAFLFSLVMMLISQNQKKVESYRAWCITIFVCIVAIYAIPFIIKLAQTIGGTFTA